MKYLIKLPAETISDIVLNSFHGIIIKSKSAASVIKLIVAVLLFNLFPNYLFAQDLSAGQVNCKANVLIETDNDSSIIFINHNFAGRGNAKEKLEAGTYIVTAEDGSDTWNAKIFSDTLKIEDCADKEINFTFNSEIYLQTDPLDVYVYNNDTLVGHTPLFISPGLNSITLQKPGYKELNINLNQHDPDEIVRLDYFGKPNGKRFFEKDIFKILAGSIVVLGGATAYFKLKADDKFDQYEITGDNELLDQTRKLDLYSGITFTALQINFGLLLYYFLAE